jgi:signal transduction histidine kinase
MALRRFVPSAWAIYLALSIVVAAAAANVIVDLIVDSRVQTLTMDIVDNALRSVSLIDDLRGQAQKLAGFAGPVPADKMGEIRALIDRDAKAYEPLATYVGERSEWEHLRTLLARLQTSDGDRPMLLREVDASIDRLAAINQAEAANKMDAIKRTQQRSFGLDIVSGLLVFCAALLVMIVVSRLIRNQRRLVEHQFEVALERQRDLEAFAGRVAHDLRHPLAPLRLSATALQRDPTDREKVVDRIVRNVDQMSGIIDSLLALSTSGQPEPGVTRVSPVITEVLEQNEVLLRGAKVAVSAQECSVGCSSTVLRQIVSNLVTNASKYRHPERNLELSITVVCEGGFAELTVADNGIGMDDATAAHIFEPMYRGEAARAIPGFGLGLAIVGRTVHALSGTYAVKSTRGTGSQFVIRLPVAPIAQPGPTVADH